MWDIHGIVGLLLKSCQKAVHIRFPGKYEDFIFSGKGQANAKSYFCLVCKVVATGCIVQDIHGIVGLLV